MHRNWKSLTLGFKLLSYRYRPLAQLGHDPTICLKLVSFHASSKMGEWYRREKSTKITCDHLRKLGCLVMGKVRVTELLANYFLLSQNAVEKAFPRTFFFNGSTYWHLQGLAATGLEPVLSASWGNGVTTNHHAGTVVLNILCWVPFYAF